MSGGAGGVAKFDAALYQATKARLAALKQQQTAAPTGDAASLAATAATPAVAAAAAGTPRGGRRAAASSTGTLAATATVPAHSGRNGAAAAPPVASPKKKKAAAAVPPAAAVVGGAASAAGRAAAAPAPAPEPAQIPVVAAAAAPAPIANGLSVASADGATGAAGAGAAASATAASSGDYSVSLFSAKLSAFQEMVMELFHQFGLKYSADAKVKSSAQELEQLYSRHARHFHAQMERAQHAQRMAEQQLVTLHATHDTDLKAARALEADKQVKLSSAHKQQLKVLQKKLADAEQSANTANNALEEKRTHMRAELRAELEPKLRAEISAELEKAGRGSRAVEDKIRALEEQAVSTIRAKELELSTLRTELGQLKARGASDDSRSGKLNAENNALKEQLALARVRIVELETLNTALSATVTQLKTQTETEQRTRQADQLQALQQYKMLVDSHADSTRSAEQKLLRAERASDELKRDHDTQVRSLKREHELELDAVHTRVKSLVQKKNLQLSALQEQVHKLQSKLTQTESYLKQTKDQLQTL